MSINQAAVENPSLETCMVCGRELTHRAYLDHLFKNKECMKKFWKEEEKMHVFRLRHRAIRNIVK